MKKIEVSFKELLVYVLRRWRLIILFSTVIAIAAMAITSIKSNMSKTPTISSSENAEPAQVPTHAAELIFGFNVVGLNIESTNLSGVDFAWWKDSVFGSLLQHYLALGQHAPLEQLFPTMDTDSLNTIAANLQLSTYAKDLIRITMLGAEGIDSKLVVERIFDYLNSKVDFVALSTGRHSLLILGEGIPQNERMHLQEEPEATPSVLTGGTDLVSAAGFGFLGGFVLSVLGAIAFYFMKLPVQTPEQILRQLGIEYLGGVRKEGKPSIGDRLAGFFRMLHGKQATVYIAANVRAMADSASSVLVTGSLSQQGTIDFAKELQTELGECGPVIRYDDNPNQSATAIDKLATSDAVIIVESLGVSSLRDVYALMERLRESDARLLGYVLI